MTNDKEAFEKWFSDDGKWPSSIERDKNGNYKYAVATNQWNIWQAARAEPAKEIAALKSQIDFLDGQLNEPLELVSWLSIVLRNYTHGTGALDEAQHYLAKADKWLEGVK